MLDSNRPVDHGPSGGGHEDGSGLVTVLERGAGEPRTEPLTSPDAHAGEPGLDLGSFGDSRVITQFHAVSVSPTAHRELEPTYLETLRDHQHRQATGDTGLVAPQDPQRPHPPEHRPHHRPDHLPPRLADHRPHWHPERGLERLGDRVAERVPEAADRRALGATAQVAAVEDEKLLAALSRLVSLVTRFDSLFPRLVFFVLGFTAITSLALAYIEALPLPVGAAFFLGPAVLTMLLLGLWFPEWGRRALIGWVAGIAATIVYDAARLAAVKMGVFGDPIPLIGHLLLNREDVPWTVGYAWRFLGNGGGMAIAFAMLPWRGVKAGTVYGTMICLGLFAVLYFFPVAQTHFFPLEPLTAVVAMLGHWIYGAVLGGITKRYLPPVTVRAARPAGGTWIPAPAVPRTAAPAI